MEYRGKGITQNPDSDLIIRISSFLNTKEVAIDNWWIWGIWRSLGAETTSKSWDGKTVTHHGSIRQMQDYQVFKYSSAERVTVFSIFHLKS